MKEQLSSRSPHMKQSTNCLISLLLIAIMVPLAIGCGNLDGTAKATATQSPTAGQIQRCRNIMYINPELTLKAEGHCFAPGFQDDSIHFKFTTTVDSIDKIFQPNFVPSNKFKPRKNLIPPKHGLAKGWWNPSNQPLVGGDFVVPDPQKNGDRGLNVGIATNPDGTFTVYLSWIET